MQIATLLLRDLLPYTERLVQAGIIDERRSEDDPSNLENWERATADRRAVPATVGTAIDGPVDCNDLDIGTRFSYPFVFELDQFDPLSGWQRTTTLLMKRNWNASLRWSASTVSIRDIDVLNAWVTDTFFCACLPAGSTPAADVRAARHARRRHLCRVRRQDGASGRTISPGSLVRCVRS